MTEDDAVSVAELAAVLDEAEEHIRGTLGGPFKPDLPGDCFRLRVALGVVIVLEFARTEALPPNLAVFAAIKAAEGATLAGEGNLCIAWRRGRPLAGWFDGRLEAPAVEPGEDLGSPLRRPLVVIPACHMLRDLAAAVLAMRERRAGATAH